MKTWVFLASVLLTCCGLTSFGSQGRDDVPGQSCNAAISGSISLFEMRRALPYSYLPEQKLGLAMAVSAIHLEGYGGLPSSEKRIVLALLNPDLRDSLPDHFHNIVAAYGPKWFVTIDPRPYVNEISGLIRQLGVPLTSKEEDNLLNFANVQIKRERDRIQQVDGDLILKKLNDVDFESIRIIGIRISEKMGLNFSLEFLGDLHQETMNLIYHDYFVRTQPTSQALKNYWPRTTSAFGQIKTLKSREEAINFLKYGIALITHE